MKLNRPAIWGSLGVVALVGFVLGGLDDTNHTGSYKTLNSVGNILFWAGIGALLLSIGKWYGRWSERRKETIRSRFWNDA